MGIGVPEQELWDEGERNKDLVKRTKGKKGRKDTKKKAYQERRGLYSCLARKNLSTPKAWKWIKTWFMLPNVLINYFTGFSNMLKCFFENKSFHRFLK